MVFNPMQDAEYPNLINVTKRLDPDGKVAVISEMLTKSAPTLMDIPVFEANMPTGHRTTIRADLPTPTWRKLYEGVKPTKSNTIQVDDTMGMLEDYAAVDKDLAMLNGNTQEFRLSEDTPHIEGMSQEMASTLWYGDIVTSPKKFTGIMPRYDSLDIASSKPTATTRSGQLKHVVSMGGSDNLASMVLIGWGPNSVFGIYPKGSQMGLLHEDMGQKTLQDENGGWFEGYQSHYQWKMGLVVKDWRHIVRICNIDVTTLDDEASQKLLYKAMIKALHTVPANSGVRYMWYCPPVLAAMLDMAAVEKANIALGYKNVFGQEITSFRNVPIRADETMLEDEAVVS